MNRILIIGATVNIGRQVLSQLLAQESVSLPPEVEVMRADLTVPETLDRCLEDIDTVFLVWVAPAGYIVPALERIARHARRIVFISAPLKTDHPFFQQPNPVRDMHAEIERVIEASGLQWTFLRPGMLSANALHFWGPQTRAGNLVLAIPFDPNSPHRRA